MQKIVLRIKLESGIIKAVLQQHPVPGDRLLSSGDKKNIPSSALQAATILVAMASGKNFWRPKFWESQVMVTILQLKVAKTQRFEKVSLERCSCFAGRPPF